MSMPPMPPRRLPSGRTASPRIGGMSEIQIVPPPRMPMPPGRPPLREPSSGLPATVGGAPAATFSVAVPCRWPAFAAGGAALSFCAARLARHSAICAASGRPLPDWAASGLPPACAAPAGAALSSALARSAARFW
jgi:hypothetical protein